MACGLNFDEGVIVINAACTHPTDMVNIDGIGCSACASQVMLAHCAIKATCTHPTDMVHMAVAAHVHVEPMLTHWASKHHQHTQYSWMQPVKLCVACARWQYCPSRFAVHAHVS
jgi:hypothetical protein